MTTMLPATLDTAAAGQLRSDLNAMVERHDALTLDGSAVDRIGQAGLQVLAAAQIAAVAAGIAFTIETPSAALAEMARLARLDTLLPTQG